MEHPSLATLLSLPDAPETVAHLASCMRCRDNLERSVAQRGAVSHNTNTSRAAAWQPGRRVGRYRIERELGAGGMAVVYLARHIQLGSLHALKVLQTRTVDRYDRLLAEGQAQSRLSHPHLVPVTDVIEADGALALVMAFVSGPTLQQLMAAGPLTLLQADHLARGILKGVAAAHRAGLVHRDLKPGNVLLAIIDGDVQPKVTDFGLVKAAGEDATTRPGLLLGTPAYMSPEQIIDADTVDTRSDVFSLGALLYELLCGGRAFMGPDLAGLMAAVTEVRYRSLSTRVQDLPERMLSAVTAALAGAREERPADAGVLLQQWQQGAPDLLQDPSHPEALALAARVTRLTQALPERLLPMGVPVETPPSLVSTFARTPRERPLPGQLPVERDDFVGRVSDIIVLAQHLARETRLVTVLGTGGVGKTRLVVHYGWKYRIDWPGGVYFCDLTEAKNEDGIVLAVARALDVPLAKGDAVAQLGHAITSRGRCLVLLDNFEQVTAHARATLGRWLDCTAEAAFVVTTRERLGLDGETLLSLEPLPEEDAVKLFVARARAADRLFDPAEEPSALHRLAELLDGLPLAIELAAARVHIMGPSQQLARIQERFRLLTSTDRTDRHATLGAVLDWSFTLLTDSERAALSQLSVFEGGLSLAAAEGVLDIGEEWPADIMQSLVDKSLLRKVATDRFQLLVSIKEYAAARLSDSGGSAQAEVRHGRYYARYGAREAQEALDGPGGGQRRKALAQELDNLSAASSRAVARADGPVASDTALAAWAVLELRGPFARGLSLLEAAAAQSPHDVRVLCRASKARQCCGQMAQAREHCERALQLVQASGERQSEAIALSLLGNLHQDQGQMEEALARYESALQIARDIGPRNAEGLVLTHIGTLYTERGRMDEARVYHEAALQIFREIGNDRAIAVVLGNLGSLHLGQGHFDEACTCYESALEIHRETSDRRAMAVVLGNLGNLRQRQGRMDEAHAHYKAALHLHREIGNRQSEGLVLANLGILHKEQGRLDEARACYESALVIHRALGNRRIEGVVSGNLGILHKEQGRLDEAHACYESALEIHRALGNRRAETVVLNSLGVLNMSRGLFDEAQRYYEAALDGNREVGNRPFMADVLGNLGRLHHEQGRLDEALAHYNTSLQMSRESGHPQGEGMVLINIGRLHAEQGRLASANTCFETAEVLLRSLHDLVNLGDLLATRAIALHAASPDEAREALRAAEQIAKEIGAGPDSPLGRSLAHAAALCR